MIRKACFNFLLGLVFLFVFTLPLYAEEKKEEETEPKVQQLAKKLQNPVAKLTNFQFQNNFEHKLGPEEEGYRYTLRSQPIIPISLNEDWNLIFLPIIPYIYQRDVIANTKQKGLGDTQIECSFSPAKKGPGGIIWGAGTVFLLPTAASEHLGYQKYGVGPNGVIIKQTGPWTMLLLANHTWAVAGNKKRQDVDATYLQPMFAHSSKKGFTVVASSESTYDWTAGEWTVPLICTVSQILPLYHGHYASIGGGNLLYAGAV